MNADASKPIMLLDRRRFVGGAGLLLLAGMPLASAAAQVGDDDAAEPPAGGGFTFGHVVELAQARASATYGPRLLSLPAPFADLTYEAYRGIRFRPDRRLWHGEGRNFSLELLPPGLVFNNAVQVSVVEDGRVVPCAFDPGIFEFDPASFDPALVEALAADPDAARGLTYSGFSVRFPINSPDADDEVLIFQGGSYFRAIARDLLFGLSARGLAIRTGAPEGEEFPVFTDFWIRRPDENASSLRVHALLDSPSLAGAYDFVVRPGTETVMETRAVLFPRVELAQIGLAPLTSMYYFGPKDRTAVDDYRNAAHNSSGLEIITGRSERLWRPLTNPAALQVSVFMDENPVRFGLAQRQRSFHFYQDAQARYDRRPSAWVAPVGDWGPGGVMLVEIPTRSEFNDNIVAFWRPSAPLPAGQPFDFGYRLTWSGGTLDAPRLARVTATRSGLAADGSGERRYVVDFDTGEREIGGLVPTASASRGEIRGTSLQRLPNAGGARVVIAFAPPSDGAAELRLLLEEAGQPASETWLFRWTP